MSENLTYARFAACIGDAFRLQLPEDGGAVELELVAARALERAGEAGRAEPFAIEFRGPAEPSLSQGAWRLEHPELGPADIFLVPVGPDEHGPCYEAVFN